MPERRERVVFWAIVAALVVATAIAWLLLVGPAPGSRRSAEQVAAAPAGLEPAPARLALAAVQGEVTLVRRGVSARAAVGDAVHPGDAVSTAAGASAEIAGGPYRVALREDTRVAVREASAARARLRLEGGLVAARLAREGVVEVEVPSGATARAGEGSLWVARSGPVVAAAVRGGKAELRGGWGAIPLGDGEEATVADGAAPQPVAPLPAALPLEVRWPPRRIATPRVVVTGKTAPGARVVLAGAPVEVGADGSFSRELELAEGAQRLEARAEAVGGLAARSAETVTLDTRGPGPRFDTRRLWQSR